MKKIIFILFILFLSGCGRSSVNTPSTIILKIDSEVNPIITSTYGKGTYDEINKEYTITLKNTTPIDISLSYEGYESKVISFSTTELIKGHVIKNVSFNNKLSALLELNIITEANLEDIKIEGFKFNRDKNVFKIPLPSIDSNYHIIITATEDYRPFTLDINPNDLVTGIYKRDLYLIKNDQVYLNFENVSNDYTDLFSIDGEKIEGVSFRNINTYVVNKNDLVFYRDNNNSEEYFVDTSCDQMINNIRVDRLFNRIYYTKNFDFNKQYYFEVNEKRYSLSEILREGAIYLPPYAKILYIEEENGEFKYYYHKGFEPLASTIDFSLESFYEPVNRKINIKLYDIVNKKYLTEATVDNQLETADSNGYFHLKNIYIIKGYNPVYINFNEEKLIDGEWVFERIIYPIFDGVIIDFVDAENNPIDVTINHLDYILLDNQKKVYTSFFIFEDNYSFFNISFLTLKDGREINMDYRLFIQMFDYVEYNNQHYFQIKESIKIDNNTDIQE